MIYFKRSYRCININNLTFILPRKIQMNREINLAKKLVKKIILVNRDLKGIVNRGTSAVLEPRETAILCKSAAWLCFYMVLYWFFIQTEKVMAQGTPWENCFYLELLRSIFSRIRTRKTTRQTLFTKLLSFCNVRLLPCQRKN